ncbi:MAG: type II secretion system GspH family protein [Candidatus Peribacteria bacterium]|jgi:type II secretory pathway pseudopilin PulG|nr:type II secretion system GspH family protein [Candidatus Peribacteria bacterium]
MKKVRAFTLIETLIVIAVFTTGILAVLYGMAQTLRSQDIAKTQINSAFFAREGIELMYHLRDSNYRKKLPRNCIFHLADNDLIQIEEGKEQNNPFCGGYFQTGTILKIEMKPEGYTEVTATTQPLPESFAEKFEAYQLYYATGDDKFSYTYHPQENQEGLRYARYIEIKGVYEGDILLPPDKILKIESHVLFQKGALTGEKIIESFIGNYEI